MKFRDRITELRRVRAGDLVPHPRNWRTHPESQRAALQGILAEVGYADALLARALPDGRLQLIDGHLRAEVTPEALVPVLVLDVNEQEAEKLLATLDPLAALAGSASDALAELLNDIQTENAALENVWKELLAEASETSDAAADKRTNSPDDNAAESPAQRALDTDLTLPALYQVIVECPDEPAQQQLFTRLRAEGYECKLCCL